MSANPTAPRPELSVGAIVIHQDRLLLVERGRPPGVGLWSVPGGRVESGETLAEAVEREVLEETGCRVRCGRFVGLVERISPEWHFVILDFVADLATSADVLTPGDDAADAAWVDLATVDDRPVVPGLLPFLREHAIIPSGWARP
ncbi:MAG: NUDIX hydrolase [Acidimicrobiales bacterium]